MPSGTGETGACRGAPGEHGSLVRVQVAVPGDGMEVLAVLLVLGQMHLAQDAGPTALLLLLLLLLRDLVPSHAAEAGVPRVGFRVWFFVAAVTRRKEMLLLCHRSKSAADTDGSIFNSCKRSLVGNPCGALRATVHFNSVNGQLLKIKTVLMKQLSSSLLTPLRHTQGRKNPHGLLQHAPPVTFNTDSPFPSSPPALSVDSVKVLCWTNHSPDPAPVRSFIRQISIIVLRA